MDDCDYHNGLDFGQAGLQKLLELARSAMGDPDSCEKLYDLARSATLLLIRCDREASEVEKWKEGLERIVALSRGSRDSFTSSSKDEDGPDYLLQTAHRFEALAHLLADLNFSRESYNLGNLLDLPFTRQTVLFLSRKKGQVSKEEYLQAMGIKFMAPIIHLAQLRFVQWDEHDGRTHLWLSRDGQLLAIDLETEQREKEKGLK